MVSLWKRKSFWPHGGGGSVSCVCEQQLLLEGQELCSRDLVAVAVCVEDTDLIKTIKTLGKL